MTVEFRIERTPEGVLWSRVVTISNWPRWDGYRETGQCDYWSDVEKERERSKVVARVGRGRYIEFGYE